MGSSPGKEQRKNSNASDLNIKSEAELQIQEQVRHLLKENEELKAQVTKLAEKSTTETKQSSNIKPVSGVDDMSIQIREQMDRIKELKDELYIQQQKTTKLKSRYNARLKVLKTEVNKQAQEHAVRVCELQQQITELTTAAKELQSSAASQADGRPTTGDTKTRLILELSQKIAEQDSQIAELRNRLGEADNNNEEDRNAKTRTRADEEAGLRDDGLESSHWRSRAMRAQHDDEATKKQQRSGDRTGNSQTLTVHDRVMRSKIEVQSFSPREESYRLHGLDTVTKPIAGNGIVSAAGINGTNEFSALADIGSHTNSRENSAANNQHGKSMKTISSGQLLSSGDSAVTSLPHHDNSRALLPSVAT